MLSPTVLSNLSYLENTGVAMAWGAVLTQGAGAQRVISPPLGQVFLVTHVMVQADTLGTGVQFYTPQDQQIASPDLGVYGFDLYDRDGTVVGTASFLSFHRPQQVFEDQNSPNWRNAPPGNVMSWMPRFPIPIPSGWTVKTTPGGEFGNQVALYGYLVSEDAARTAGYVVSSASGVASTLRRNNLASASPTTSFADLIPARAGASIRILDMVVRMQPRISGTTTKLFLAQTDGRTVFSWTNNNPSDLLERQISPDIFLKADQALQIKASVAGVASVTVSYEYVDAANVPGDVWWAYVEPDLPTPSVTKVGVTSVAPNISTALTCYYPARDTTKTSPLTGYQHILRGFEVNIQKNTAIRPEQTFLCLSTGTSGGIVGFADSQTNIQLTPTFTASNHDECVYGGLSNLNLPCVKDTGTIWADTQCIAAGNQPFLQVVLVTPSTTDADVDEWSVTAWGKTVPVKFGNPINRGA